MIIIFKTYLILRGIVKEKDYEELMNIVTDDIKFNRIGFGKKTTAADVIAIAKRTAKVLERCS